ncbi:MAG: tetratricopeptide repeat protein [Candidatus Krumholzibacteriota bacterium]|nr:tetratricopeptide repeat protein [Candidatus Krumholzibacteriota bacterium]
MKKTAAFVLLLLLAASPAAGGETVPLADQLEGLAPEPRIAYLRYLIEQHGPDAETLFQLGVAWHEKDEPDSALAWYERASRYGETAAKSFVNMGVIHDDAGRLSLALQMYEKALAVDPDDVLARSHAAFIRFQFRDFADAWEDLSHALAVAPDHPQPHFYLAIFFWESRIYREALREWERVIELEPDGYLALKARENVVMLQKALNAPTDATWEPVR